jgi:hypothetical protein
MTDRPWETEPDRLDFEADGLPCAMRRNDYGVWCGYVGVGPEHPLFGLPTNHPLKLPSSWFEGREVDQGVGAIDLFIQMIGGPAMSIAEACPIGIAMHIHGGLTYADEHPDAPDDHWWFGFDCGHAGDLMPRMPNVIEIMREVIETMPEKVRDVMRDIMAKQDSVYRDQQYVVGECQSLAAQLNAIVAVIDREKSDNQRD